MKNTSDHSLWKLLENITGQLKYQRLADVFRFVSFRPGETFGPHQHVRIEINYVKKGSCMLHLEDETVHFGENEMMVISSNVPHTFESGSDGTTLMQLEFLPELFSRFDMPEEGAAGSEDLLAAVFPVNIPLIKIVNNVRIMRAVQRIVNEMNAKSHLYRYLVLMYYAELLVLICRYMDETYLPVCTHEEVKKAVVYIHLHYQTDISIQDIARETCVGERYLRKLFTRFLHTTPLDYLNRVRVDKSADLLRNTEMSVKEISFACGFKSPQYFAKVFKQQTGLTPREMTK